MRQSSDTFEEESGSSFAFRRHSSSASESSDVVTVEKAPKELRLSREEAAPVYAPPRSGPSEWKLVKGEGGEMIANYKLWEAAIQKTEIPWNNYDLLTSDERTVHMAHCRAVQERKMTYQDPFTKNSVFTVSQLLLNGSCCGNGCRHCPYGLENASDPIKRSKKWNGAYWL